MFEPQNGPIQTNSSQKGGYGAYRNSRPPSKNEKTYNAGQLKEVNVSAYETFEVCLDPGHGDNNSKNSQFDPGAHDGHGTFFEKDLALVIALSTRRWLKEFGIKTFMTREADIEVDPEGPVNWRWKLANKREASVLVSFHLDAGEKTKTFAVYQQGIDATEAGKSLAEAITGELSALDISDSSAVHTVKDKTRYNSLGVLSKFSGNAATLLEFGGVGSVSNRLLIMAHHAKIGFWTALGIYKYIRGGAEPDYFDQIHYLSQNIKTWGEILKDLNKL